MSSYLLLKFAHLLLLVVWLGAEIGVFYSSRFVIDPKLTPPQRATALNILLGCDLLPRLAMPLAITTGVHLASMLGLIKLNGLGLIIVWIICLGWLILVMTVHHEQDKVKLHRLEKIDVGFRVIMITIIYGAAIFSFFNSDYISAKWLNWKLILFATTVLCGLGIRYHLKKFVPAFQRLMVEGPDDEVNKIIRKSIDDCLPYVFTIWTSLLLCAALGLHLI